MVLNIQSALEIKADLHQVNLNLVQLKIGLADKDFD